MRNEDWSERVIALVRLHQADLWRFLRFLGCEADLADDLLQETFVSVWRKPFEERTDAATRAYLRTAVKNRFLMAVRHRRAQPTMFELDEAEHAWQAHTESDGGRTYRDALETCLRLLTPRTRKTLQLYYREKNSRDEIAANLGIRLEGVKSILRRAKESLRQCIAARVQS